MAWRPSGRRPYYRSSDKKSPHNAYTSGQRLTEAIEKLGYSTAYDPAYAGHYRFARDGNDVSLEERPGVMDAAAAETGYLLNQAYFLYDEEDGPLSQVSVRGCAPGR